MKRFFVSICFLLSACSNLPVALRNAPEVDIKYLQATANNQAYDGMPVRWGGVIIDVENQQHLSKAQILYYPLYRYARPNVNKQPQGRFVVHSSKFLDPEIFTKGKAITIAGKIKGTTEKKIGKKIVKLPVIIVSDSYVWPKERYSGYNSFSYSPYIGYSSYRIRAYGYPYRYSACY
jgi:outer membrane lipoprotein